MSLYLTVLTFMFIILCGEHLKLQNTNNKYYTVIVNFTLSSSLQHWRIRNSHMNAAIVRF